MRQTTNYNLTLISPTEDSQQTSATFINKLCGYSLPDSAESNMEILDRVIKDLHDNVVSSNADNGYININGVKTQVYLLPSATDIIRGGVRVGANITRNIDEISVTAENIATALGGAPIPGNDAHNVARDLSYTVVATW